MNVAGSYLFEPAGSIHTLHVPDTNTEVTDVFFAIHGANLNLDDIKDAMKQIAFFAKNFEKLHPNLKNLKTLYSEDFKIIKSISS